MHVALVGVASAVAVMLAACAAPSSVTVSASPSAPTPSQTPVSPAGLPGSGCPHSAESADTAVPPDLRWADSSAASWPVSPSIGPTQERNGLGVCFAHSPIGAALAAVNFLYSHVDHSPIALIDAYVARTPGREAALLLLNGHSDSAVENEVLSGAAPAGFRIERAEADSVSVTSVLDSAMSTTGYRGWELRLVWNGGDWKVKLLDDGSTGSVNDIGAGSFTEWPAR